MSTAQAKVSERILYAMGSMVEDERKVTAIIRYINSLHDEQPPCQFTEEEMQDILSQATAEARKESRQGETVVCKNKAEMQQYFDSL